MRTGGDSEPWGDASGEAAGVVLVVWPRPGKAGGAGPGGGVTVSSDRERRSGRRDGRTIGVLGARGGAGASTLAALLAHTLARGGHTALVQVGAGASLDVVLGTEREPGVRWPDLGEARGDVDPDQLAGALRRWRRCGVLVLDDDRPAPIPEPVERDVLAALRRGHRHVVVDLDRMRALDGGAGPAVDACDRVVLVVPRDIPAVAGARLLLPRLPDGLRVGIVTRRPAPGGLHGAEIATTLGHPLLADLPGGRMLARSVDSGVGPVPGARVAGAVRRLVRALR